MVSAADGDRKPPKGAAHRQGDRKGTSRVGGSAAPGTGSGAAETRARPSARAGEDRARDRRQIQPPESADPRDLDSEVRSALRSLAGPTADRVAAHLVAVGDLLEDDPAAALEQARVARAFASRIGIVREAVGLAAYAAGEWHEALAEFRAERRLTGSTTHLPEMADCERGLGRPDRALELAWSAEVADLDPAGRVEMLIVASGARRDLGQPDAAVVTLQAGGLDRDAPEPGSVRLWYAYADALLASGRRDEARQWFQAAADIDEGETDAEERLLEFAVTRSPES